MPISQNSSPKFVASSEPKLDGDGNRNLFRARLLSN